MTKWLIAAVAATLLTGCNTIAGIGKDVQALGGAVDKAATETKKKM
jgi:predicted small secreted protein